MDWKAMKITSLCPSGGGVTRNTAKAMAEGHFLGSGSPPEANIRGSKLSTLLTGAKPHICPCLGDFRKNFVYSWFWLASGTLQI